MDEKYLSVLLIEDNVYDVRFLKRTLLREPLIELEHADSLSDALKRLKKGGVDVILLDLSLGESKGLETFDLLYSEVSDLPIVVLTGYNDEDLAVATLRRGAQDYLVKGLVDTSSLVRAMRYAIERKHAELHQLNSQRDFTSLVEDLRSVRSQEADLYQQLAKDLIPSLTDLRNHLKQSEQERSAEPKSAQTEITNQLDAVLQHIDTVLDTIRNILNTH